jgi:hypothetical protein
VGLAQTVVGEGDERRVLLGDEQLLQIVVGPLEVAEVAVSLEPVA